MTIFGFWGEPSIFIFPGAFEGTKTAGLVRGELETWILAKFGKKCMLCSMATMNISLPYALKTYVDEQVTGRGYGTSSEYVRELIRKDQDRQRLRGLLLEGTTSPETDPIDKAYFAGLRDRVKDAVKRD